MNTRNKFILGALIIVIIVLFYNNVYTLNQLNKQRETNSLLYEELENKYLPFSDILCYLQKEAEIIKNFQQFKLYLNDSTFQTPLLIYRYTNSICEGCIEEDLNNLENFIPEIGKESIWILPSIEENRENRIYLHNKLKKFNYQNISFDTFKVPLDCENKVEQRFFILINKKKEVKSVFFPLRSHPNFTKEFFIKVKNIISQEKATL